MSVRSQAGLNLLELSVALAVFATLAGSLLSAVLFYQEWAEKVVVEATIVNVRSGLRWQVVDRLINGRQSGLSDLVVVNPVRWLEREPAGYIGERANVSASDLEPGTWVYDTYKREVGYRPKLHSHLVGPEDGVLRWRVRARRIVAAGVVEGIEIEQVRNYKWF